MFKSLKLLLPILILLTVQVQAQDAGVLRFTSPVPPIIPGFNYIEVTVYNFDSIPLTDVIVEWTVDGVQQAPVLYSTPIASLDSVNIFVANFILLPGCYIIKAWTDFPNNVSDIVPSNDTAIINTCLTAITPSLKEISNKILEADLYPNPSIEEVTLDLKIKRSSDVRVEIVDLKGQSVFRKDYGTLIGELKDKINLKHLPNGMYFLHLQTNEGFLSKKLIIGTRY